MQGLCDVYKWTILKRTSPEVKCLQPTSSRREMCTPSVSNVIYHKISHGAAFYTLNGKNVNVMFSRHLYIIYTSLHFECFILIFQTNHFFVVFSYVNLKQISYRKAITSFIRSHISVLYFRSGQVVQWYWANFQCRGILLVWIKVGQGPAALAVGPGGGFSGVCFLSSISSHFFIPLSRRRSDID